MDHRMSDIADDEIGTPDQQEFWRDSRLSSPDISLVRRSTAKPVPPVDPNAPVKLPDA
jgi:hypothetical protein